MGIRTTAVWSCAAALLVAAGPSLHAATVVKDDNTNNLDQGSSWVGGVAPGALDIATFNSVLTGANSTVLGSNQSWLGLALIDPAGAVTIGAGNTLTLGTGGIDLSAATQNLTIQSGLTLSPGGRTFNVATGQTLAINTGVFTRNTGATLLFDRSANTGTVAFSPTVANGIVGPWAIHSSSGAATNGGAGGFTFATVSGGNIVAYTGATSQTGTGAWGGIASGGTGTVNHDISSAGTLGVTGLSRNVNTLRYTGTGATQAGNINAVGNLLTANAIINAGTGTFNIGGTGGTNNYGINITAGATNELVLGAMSADILIRNGILNGANPSALTIVGGSGRSVTISGATSNYSGSTFVNSGSLVVSGAGSINSTSDIVVNGGGAKYLHTSSVAGTKPVTLTRGTVDGVGTIGAVTVADLGSNVVTNGNAGTGVLTAGSLTFAGDATATVRYNGAAGLAVTGALTTTPANGTVTINPTLAGGGWSNGLNNLISYGSLSGAIGDFTLGTVTGLGPRQAAGALQLNGNNIALSVSGESLVWSGAGSNTWTTATTGDNTGPNNWATATAQTGTNFWAADVVSFNDTYDVTPGAGGTTPVTATSVDISAANVSPASTTFNNTAVNYTVGSSGGFGIASGSVTKNGTGTVVVTSANTTTGAIAVNAGTLQIGDGTTDGSFASAAYITNNASLVYNVATAQSYGNAIGGTGSVTKSGGGTLTLSGANNYGGGTTVSAGTVTLNGSGTLGTGAISLAGGTTLNVNSPQTIGATQTVSGSGAINNTAAMTINGDFTGYSGTYTHNSSTVSTGLNSATATSKDAAYVVAAPQGSAQGLIVAGNGNYTLEMGSLTGVANSLVRGGNSATGTSTLKVGNLNTNTFFEGQINNGATKTLAIEKVGTGSLKLGGVNGYTGTTTVSGGALILSSGASLATASTVSVTGVGSVLGGNGTVGGTTTVTTGGAIAPGESIGLLTFSGNVSVDPTSSLQIEYDDGTQTIDLLAAGGTLTLDGNINFAPINGSLLTLASYTFATFSSMSGSFTTTNVPVGYTVVQNPTSLMLNAIPEASTILCGGVVSMLVGVGAIVRRRRQQA